jgi:hypothetical protein
MGAGQQDGPTFPAGKAKVGESQGPWLFSRADVASWSCDPQNQGRTEDAVSEMRAGISNNEDKTNKVKMIPG